MTLLIFFSIVFATIILAIVLQKLINSPILVGFTFFAIFLVVAAILNNITYIIFAIALGILAFFVAFLYCLFSCSGFFRNNECLLGTSNSNSNNNSCGNSNGNNGNNGNNNNGNNGNNNDTLTILNNDGDIVATISGNSITCNDNDNTSNCGCNGRYYRYRRTY